MNKFYLICIFLCAPSLGSAQEIVGDSLYAIGEYARASVAYEYAYFSATGAVRLNEILLKRTYSLKHIGKYEGAFQNLDRADFYQGVDSLRFLLFYESALNAFLAKKADIAWSKLQEIQFEFSDSILKRKILPIEILTLNALNRWQQAHEKFKKFAVLNGLTEDPYPEILNFKMKKPNMAMNLSYFLPGIGQMYAGYFWKGAVSTMLNIGMISFSIWSYLGGYYLSGTFTGVALFYLSYNGGARYAEALANQFNESHIEKFRVKVADKITRTPLK